MSRVAVHLPPGHPHGAPDEPVVVAYKLGRIRDGIDNHVLHTGETVPLDEFAAGLISQARRDYPEEGVRVVIERLVMKPGVDEAEWIPAEDFDPGSHTPAGSGAAQGRTFHVESGQEA